MPHPTLGQNITHCYLPAFVLSSKCLNGFIVLTCNCHLQVQLEMSHREKDQERRTGFWVGMRTSTIQW
ncbi:hypothetical protein SRHO_G00287900 [Serrasalmus rhombeus]